jgi:hypothetical protein
MEILGVREKSNTRGNDSTNRSCRKKNLNPGKSTAPQLRSPAFGTQIIKPHQEIKKYNLLNNSPTVRQDLHLGHRKHNKACVRLFFPEDNETNDSAVHKQIREQIKEPIDTR